MAFFRRRGTPTRYRGPYGKPIPVTSTVVDPFLLRGPRDPRFRERLWTLFRRTYAGDISKLPPSPPAINEFEDWGELFEHGMLAARGNTVADFVYGRAPLYVHSTNVAWAQYDSEYRHLKVVFHPGRRSQPGRNKYLYGNVSEPEATEFARTASKGQYVWARFVATRTHAGKPTAAII